MKFRSIRIAFSLASQWCGAYINIIDVKLNLVGNVPKFNGYGGG